MSRHRQQAHPPGKSKTDLRRGQLSPKQGPIVKTERGPTPASTSITEQTLLFDLSSEPPRSGARQS